MSKTYKNIALVALPLAIPKVYGYQIPDELIDKLQFGMRVEVPLKNKLYSGLIIEILANVALEYHPRKISNPIDEKAIIDDKQLKFWKWISKYYLCHLGEVMNVALPNGLKLTSETKIILKQADNIDQYNLNDEEFLIAEALEIQNELSISDIQDILSKKTVFPIIKTLMDKEILIIKEELKEKYKVKKISVCKLDEAFLADTKNLEAALFKTKKSEHQTNALLAIYQLSKNLIDIPVTEIYNLSGSNHTALKALEKKGIISIYKKEISRLTVYHNNNKELPELSKTQLTSLDQIIETFESKNTILLHGVTGSGKTRIYIELIKRTLSKNKQVLYLLPEIALTTQIVTRLKAVFGNEIAVYHSRMNNQERVEIWKAAKYKKKIILGARSSLFLPYSDLGLIIVDEEHDTSYKQQDPSPRYNGRDAAIVLADLHKAKVLLGSATPSLESYFNCKNGKYGMVQLKERFGGLDLPEINVIDLKQQYKTGRMKSIFSMDLREIIQKTLENKEQVMLFQNRRGFAPTLQCNTCGWSATCNNCDINLTVHKYFEELKCHYCGYRKKLLDCCPQCASQDINQRGFGTEKIEHEIRAIFPHAKVARMDYDTTKSKNDFHRIVDNFANRKIDILVGTQMITKGFDFDHVGVVGILNADQSLQFPDFRAGERAFQLFTQVSGRAGRKFKQGHVLIQTFRPTHPIILETVAHNFPKFFAREMKERQLFKYPPFFRMINIIIKHKNPNTTYQAAQYFANSIKSKLGNRVLGPSQPSIARLRNLYIQNINIKIEKDSKKILQIKQLLKLKKEQTIFTPGFKSVRINIDVDPY